MNKAENRREREGKSERENMRCAMKYGFPFSPSLYVFFIVETFDRREGQPSGMHYIRANRGRERERGREGANFRPSISATKIHDVENWAEQS